MSVNGCYLLFVISDMTDSNNIMHRILLYMQYILHSNIYRSNLFICIWYTVFALLNKHTYLEPSSDLLLCICFLQLWVMSLLWLILSSLPSLSLSAPPALPVRKECDAQKGRFLAFFCQNIYTTFVSWMCERTTTTNCDERRGTRDERRGTKEEGEGRKDEGWQTFRCAIVRHLSEAALNGIIISRCSSYLVPWPFLFSFSFSSPSSFAVPSITCNYIICRANTDQGVLMILALPRPEFACLPACLAVCPFLLIPSACCKLQVEVANVNKYAWSSGSTRLAATAAQPGQPGQRGQQMDNTRRTTEQKGSTNNDENKIAIAQWDWDSFCCLLPVAVPLPEVGNWHLSWTAEPIRPKQLAIPLRVSNLVA